MTHRRLLRFIRIAAFAAALVLPSAQSLAACQIGSVSSVAFGPYDVYSAIADAGVGSFSVSNCSDASRAYIASLSTGYGSYSTRIMRSGSNQLQYNLYTSNAYATVWGDHSGSTVTISNTNAKGGGVGPTHTIYGLIPAGQDAAVGSYTDSITITISF